MPNKKSAAKRVRQNERRRTHNRAKRSEMRSSVKTVRSDLEHNSLEGIEQKLSLAQAKLDKAAKTNLIKKGNASRKISRLAKAVRKAQEAQQQG